MKKFYTPGRNTFFADSIEMLVATRNCGYWSGNRNGRIKHAFIYTETGAIVYQFIDRSLPPIEAKAGEVVFLPKATAYTSQYLENGTRVKIVQFDLLFGTLPDFLSAPTRIEVMRAGEMIDGFFSEARPHPLLCLSRLCELIYRIGRENEIHPVKFKKLKVALDDIHTNLTQNRKISYYAELCDMSEPGFRRLFREYTGESPVDYRNSLRLEQARLLMENGECNVSEAAEAVGFSNLSFFIRLYKKKYGHTPKNG